MRYLRFVPHRKVKLVSLLPMFLYVYFITLIEYCQFVMPNVYCFLKKAAHNKNKVKRGCNKTLSFCYSPFYYLLRNFFLLFFITVFKHFGNRCCKPRNALYFTWNNNFCCFAVGKLFKTFKAFKRNYRVGRASLR